jgi:SsrA-binding protein
MSEKIVIARNKKARHDYFINEVIEVGIVLTGTEVKSLRDRKASIGEAYASAEEGDIYLINAHIAEYPQAKYGNHHPRRKRKLLLHRKQIEKFGGNIKKKGISLIPLNLYFNKRGIAKLEIAIVKGKKQHDKRQTIKERDWQRNKERVLKG